MRKFFKVGKTYSFSKSFLLWVVVLTLIGDFNSLFARYSSRQIAKKVPYGFKTKFWIYTPPGYSESKAGFPLLISLHGGSAIGDNLTMLFEQTHENPPQLIHINKWFDLPFIVVSPQLKRDHKVPHYNEQNWPPELVDEVIEYVIQKYNVDPKRIYITGISLGAAGAWQYAIAHPEKVAALLPMGGQAPRSMACKVKDIPIWAFHGENDVFVRTRFTTDMVSSINECSPAGKYKPHATICKSMEHEVWDQIFNKTGSYDVYKWMLSFRKGESTKVAPFVFTGLDRKMKLAPGPMYLTGEYFDSDGSIERIEWSQVDNGSDALELENPTSDFLKIKEAKRPGKYTFRLTAWDNDGLESSDEITINLVEDHQRPAIVSLSLTNATGSAIYGPLSNDQVYDISSIGNKVNVLATTDGFNVHMRWSVNTDQKAREVNQFHLRFWKNYGPFFLRAPAEGVVKSGWTVTPGEYLVCATAFANGITTGDREGTSLCYKIIFVDGATASNTNPTIPQIMAASAVDQSARPFHRSDFSSH
jgi:hypothetical protein